MEKLYRDIIPQALALCAAICPVVADAQEKTVVDTVFNSSKVILASSQYTPSQQYDAQTYVINSGLSYSADSYSKIWGVPADDAVGRKWFENAYELTDGESLWEEHKSPFSSDEVYKDHTSYRWIPAEIMGDIYMRRSFTLTQPLPDAVFLTCGHDDAPSEFYINGTLVHTVSDGWNNDKYVLLSPEQRALIKTDGTENIIALHVHQNWGGAFADCGLYGGDIIQTTHLLATKPAAGDWHGYYYFLTGNAELDALDPADWAGNDEKGMDAEADFQSPDTEGGGYGPYSNSDDQFKTTYWNSDLYPLLVRRHFTLTADRKNSLANSTVTLSCSYDEYPKVYLNGTLIWQHDGWNDNDYATYNLTDEQKALLVEGDNVLAVSVRQGGGGGHIDYGLYIKQEVTTGITTVSSDKREQHADGRIYTLSGICKGTSMKNLPAGIYIANGRKVIKK